MVCTVIKNKPGIKKPQAERVIDIAFITKCIIIGGYNDPVFS